MNKNVGMLYYFTLKLCVNGSRIAEVITLDITKNTTTAAGKLN